MASLLFIVRFYVLLKFEAWPINNLNAAALEVRNRIKCPFTVRILDEDDFLLSSISTKGKFYRLLLFLLNS